MLSSPMQIIASKVQIMDQSKFSIRRLSIITNNGLLKSCKTAWFQVRKGLPGLAPGGLNHQSPHPGSSPGQALAERRDCLSRLGATPFIARTKNPCLVNWKLRAACNLYCFVLHGEPVFCPEAQNVEL